MVDANGFMVDGTGVMVDGTGFMVDGTRFMVEGTGFMVDETGFMVDGTGFISKEIPLVAMYFLAPIHFSVMFIFFVKGISITTIHSVVNIKNSSQSF
jgi:hypothetical protein